MVLFKLKFLTVWMLESLAVKNEKKAQLKNII